MKLAIIREEKNPPDSRVVFTPIQCQKLINQGIDLFVQSSAIRSYHDDEYLALGVPVVEDISNCDIMIGVKEVPKENLIPNKTYFFFSHTIKEQPYNKALLQEVIKKNIRLIDYEVITDENKSRLIAFGKFAGMVGAHNGMWTYGKKTGLFSLPRLHQLANYGEAMEVYAKTKLPDCRIVLTGTGRVSSGAAKVLVDMGVKKISPIEFLKNNANGAVFTQLSSFYYVARKDGEVFDNVYDFYNNPKEFESQFHHFLPSTDIMINGIYWDNDAPAFFTIEQMKSPDFGLKVIADVTCDIAPVSSIPSTLKASTIPDPVFGYDPQTGSECEPYTAGSIDMMTIDNLPNELPRDASQAFGEMFIEHVLPELQAGSSELLDRATIAQDGELTSYFQYLESYIKE